MKPFEEAFPDCQETVVDGWRELQNAPSYDDMVNAWGFEKLIESHDDDYQGDSRFLLRNAETGHIGYLNFGWGSCSGCDALQRCETVDELKTLYASLFNDIKWFKTHAQALAFFVDHDWEGDYSYHSREQREFVEKVVDVLVDVTSMKFGLMLDAWKEAA